MAERRMFAKTIIDSDAFLEMPATSQLLYFHLSMRADDEGFINSPKSIMRLIGSKDDDLKILSAKKFIIPFESGIVVIKHWKLHNYIRGDRLHETKYMEEKALLAVDENNSYTLCLPNVSQLVGNLDTEVRLGKDRLDKVSIGKVSIEKEEKQKFGEFGHVRLKESESNRLIEELGSDTFNNCIKKLDEYIQETGKKYKDHNLTIRRWVIDAVTKQKKQSTGYSAMDLIKEGYFDEG